MKELKPRKNTPVSYPSIIPDFEHKSKRIAKIIMTHYNTTMIKKTTSPYKALMIDVDGTLVPGIPDALPSVKVTKAVQKAQKLGIHVALVTGRPYNDAKHIIKQLKLTGPVSVLNGAQTIDTKTGKVLFEKLLEPGSLKKIIKLYKKHTVKFMVYDTDHDVTYTDSYKPQKPLGVATFGMPLEKVQMLVKKISTIPFVDVHQYVAWEKIGGGYGVGISHSEATKQHGILEVSKILGIDTHEIIGIGDSYNDFPMMMACGLRVAMGNAVPELKEIADYIAPSLENDGVADVIERYILNV